MLESGHMLNPKVKLKNPRCRQVSGFSVISNKPYLRQPEEQTETSSQQRGQHEEEKEEEEEQNFRETKEHFRTSGDEMVSAGDWMDT